MYYFGLHIPAWVGICYVTQGIVTNSKSITIAQRHKVASILKIALWKQFWFAHTIDHVLCWSVLVLCAVASHFIKFVHI